MAIAVSGPRLLRIKSVDRSRLEAGSQAASLQHLKDGEADPDKQKKAGARAKGASGIKQKLRGFSKQSRLNLARQMALFTAPYGIAHWTITYWKDYPTTAAGIADEKNLIAKRLKELGVFGFWHMEFQQRGAVHWHLLVCGADLERKEGLARRWWSTRTHNPHDQECLKSTPGEMGRAAWYFALHAQKEGQTPNIEVGRWWGFINRERVKEFSRVTQIASNVLTSEVIWLKRFFRRFSGSRGSLGAQGFSWFLPEIQHVRVLLGAAAAAQLTRAQRLGSVRVPSVPTLEALFRYYARAAQN